MVICVDPAECGVTKTRLFQPVFFWSPCSFSCCAQSSFQGSVDSIISISSPPSTHCWCDIPVGCDCECCPGFHKRNQGWSDQDVPSNLLTGRLWKERGAGCIRSDCQHPECRSCFLGLITGYFSKRRTKIQGSCYLRVINVRSIEVREGG